MRNWLSRRTLNQRLALLAFLLGAMSLAATPYRGTTVTLDAKELSVIVQKEQDHVAPLELASWIIEHRSDYRLVDLRSDSEFNAYHIPSAENVPVSNLADAQLGRQEKIVLYSEGGIRAAQGWMLLKAMRYKGAYILRGGLEGWKDDVLFPALATNSLPAEATRIERLKSISAFFGGQPRSASAVEAGGHGLAMPTVLARPNVAAPLTPMGGGKAGPVKKREGC